MVSVWHPTGSISSLSGVFPGARGGKVVRIELRCRSLCDLNGKTMGKVYLGAFPGAEGWKDVLQLLREQNDKMEKLARALSVIRQGMLRNNPGSVKDSVNEATEVLSRMLNTQKCLPEEAGIPRRLSRVLLKIPRLCWSRTGDPSNTRGSFSGNKKLSGKRALSTWVCSWIEGLASANTCRSRPPKPSNVEPLLLGSCPTLVTPGKLREGCWQAWEIRSCFMQLWFGQLPLTTLL